MIQLSDMMLAREIERQRVELHILSGEPIDFDVDRGLALLQSGGFDDLNAIVAVMRRHRERLDVGGWHDACAALLCVASDEQVAEWKILEAILGRVFDRLRDRLMVGVAAPELASRAASIVETTGAAVEHYARACRYRPVVGNGELSWKTRYTTRLDEHAGADEEREAYEREAFDPETRSAFDYHYATTLPPLGMAYTTACIAADLIDRYGAKSGMDRLEAIDSAADVIAWAARDLGRAA